MIIYGVDVRCHYDNGNVRVAHRYIRYTFHTLGSRQISKVTLEMRPLVEYSTLLEFLLQQAIAVFQKHQRENTA